MIRELTLNNWMCYRGKHTLELGPRAYSITAHHDSDPNLSNWSGKSSLLEAVKFAITGKTNKERKRPWLSDGEKEGGVFLTLDNGVTFSRERTKGKTIVRMTNECGEVAAQGEAETQILKYLELDESDYETVSYFQQGAMARLIRTEPEKRFDIIRGWFGLAKAEEAENRAKQHVLKYTHEYRKLKARLGAIEQMIEEDVMSIPMSSIESLRTEQEQVLEKRKTVGEARKTGRLLRELQARIEHFDDVIRRGKLLAKEIEEFPHGLKERSKELETEYRHCYASLSEASRNVVTLKVVAQGQFDGTCPVAQIQCPAKKQINQNRDAARELYEQAKEIRDEHQMKYEALRIEIAKNTGLSSEFVKKETLRESLRKEASSMREDVLEAKKTLKNQTVEDDTELDTLFENLTERSTKLGIEIVHIESSHKQREKLLTERQALVEQVAALDRKMAIARQANTIFRVTQRRITENALHAIGHRANAMLAGAGVDLSLKVQWEHEGRGMAKACEMCGMAFPTSLRVKTCETCGAERGQHVIQRLEFPLSDQSGAADDFAGISLQLSAGSWLLKKRESPWTTAMIDEPFAQMDRTVRRAAAKQLVKLIEKSSYKQIFVISHSQETTDMFGNRIEIRVAKDGTRSITTT